VAVLDADLERRQVPRQRRGIVERDAGAQHAERDRAVHGARRDQLVPQPLGEPARDRALAGTGGSIDGHHEAARAHQGSTVIAGSRASAAMRSDSFTRSSAASRISVVPRAVAASTASAGTSSMSRGMRGPAIVVAARDAWLTVSAAIGSPAASPGPWGAVES